MLHFFYELTLLDGVPVGAFGSQFGNLDEVAYALELVVEFVAVMADVLLDASEKIGRKVLGVLRAFAAFGYLDDSLRYVGVVCFGRAREASSLHPMGIPGDGVDESLSISMEARVVVGIEVSPY